MNRLLLVLVPLVAIVLTGCSSDDNPVGVNGGGNTIHVPSEAATIQAGIEAASAGDTVLVACGTYYEHDIEMKSGVYLTSETGQADCVTISAQGLGRVIYCDGVDATSSIVGFTLTEGSTTSGGGGMVCQYASSPTLTDCMFQGNQALYGGGMLCHVDSSPTLTGCVFSENQGGGMAAYFSSPMLTDCVFEENQAGAGAGMICYDSSATLTNCIFQGNQADLGGGGMACSNSSPVLTNCTFVNNSAPDGGGMVCSDASSPTLVNCIIAFSDSGEGIHCRDAASGAWLSCCDIWGNAGGDWVDCIAGWYYLNNNFSADPLFCDVTIDDFTLASNSPCLPDSNDCHVLIGALGEGCEESPVEATSWGAMKAMFR